MNKRMPTEKEMETFVAAANVPKVAQVKWIEVEAGQPDENRRLLVTNNIEARDAFGQPSHVWIISLLQEMDDPEGGYCGYSGDDLIENISHWLYLDEVLAVRRLCPYCTSDNEAIRSTYYDQTCEGCVKRMGPFRYPETCDDCECDELPAPEDKP